MSSKTKRSKSATRKRKASQSNRVAGGDSNRVAARTGGAEQLAPNRVANRVDKVAAPNRVANRVDPAAAAKQKAAVVAAEAKRRRDEQNEAFANEIWQKQFAKRFPEQMPQGLDKKKLRVRLHQPAIAELNELIAERRKFYDALLAEHAHDAYLHVAAIDEDRYAPEHRKAVRAKYSLKGIISLPQNLRPVPQFYASGDVEHLYEELRSRIFGAVLQVVADTFAMLAELTAKQVVGHFQRFDEDMIRLTFYRDVEHLEPNRQGGGTRRTEHQEHQHEVFETKYHSLSKNSWRRMPITEGAKRVAEAVPSFLRESSSIVEGDMPCSRIIGRYASEETTVPLWEPGVLIGVGERGYCLCGWDERDLAPHHREKVSQSLASNAVTAAVCLLTVVVPAVAAFFVFNPLQ